MLSRLQSNSVDARSWFNVPPDPSTLKANKATAKPAAVNGAGSELGGEDDSQPINFDTFVPLHDPSLGPAPRDTPGAFDYNAAMPQPFLPDSSVPMVSQDEAFSRAMTAMYWSGYWTAAYHVCSPPSDDEYQLTSPTASIADTQKISRLEPNKIMGLLKSRGKKTMPMRMLEIRPWMMT